LAILITLIGFGIMIMLHELGHFITAKKFGVLVHEFALGMGPKLVSFKKGETLYSIRLFPIGGFVRLEGENEMEENDNPRSFSNLHPFKRIIVLIAGAFMNVLLGFIIFTIINTTVGITPSVVKSIPEEFVDVQENFQIGDEIVKLNNTRIHTFDDVSLFMSRYDKDVLDVTLKRDGEILRLKKIELFKTEAGNLLGVGFQAEKATLLECAENALYDTAYISKAVILALYDLVRGSVSLDTLSGPVEIVSTVDQVVSTKSNYTYLSILMLFAMITVNLGVFNLLPFPALDGGSIIFALYELITRRKIKSEIVGYASIIGFVLLMLLAVVVTAGDVLDLIK